MDPSAAGDGPEWHEPTTDIRGVLTMAEAHWRCCTVGTGRCRPPA